MPINKQFKRLIEDIKANHNLSQFEISSRLGIRSTYLSDMINGRVTISKNTTDKIYELFHISYNESEPTKKTNLIPFYDDVISIGGTKSMVAEPGPNSQPVDYIDTGDWFKDATAALRHYGDSMMEYPSGCILALKEVQDKDLIVWGKDYVIETSEYRITKRIQKGKHNDHIRAYSTNKDTYPDGQLIHEPVDIPMAKIRRLLLVLGYVVKKNGGTLVYSERNSR